MILNEINPRPYMRSLETCLNKMITEGYVEDFFITEQGLEALNQKGNYKPEQIQAVNFYRFEGEVDAGDNAILYVIETNDGTKGTLVDGNGVYKDLRVSKFMNDVQTIQKMVVKH